MTLPVVCSDLPDVSQHKAHSGGDSHLPGTVPPSQAAAPEELCGKWRSSSAFSGILPVWSGTDYSSTCWWGQPPERGSHHVTDPGLNAYLTPLSPKNPLAGMKIVRHFRTRKPKLRKVNICQQGYSSEGTGWALGQTGLRRPHCWPPQPPQKKPSPFIPCRLDFTYEFGRRVSPSQNALPCLGKKSYFPSLGVDHHPIFYSKKEQHVKEIDSKKDWVLSWSTAQEIGLGCSSFGICINDCMFILMMKGKRRLKCEFRNLRNVTF